MNKLLLPISVILLSCFCGPFGVLASNLVTEEPEKENVVGVYELSVQRVVDETVVNDAISHIEIFPDRTCNLVNFPVFVEEVTFEYEFQKLYTGKCNWETTTTGGTNRGWDVVPIWGVCFNGINFDPADKCANFVSNGNLYNLKFVFGDPDSNRNMIFSKISTK